MKIWKGTSTLDGLVDDLEFASEKSEAEILLIGGKAIDLDEFPKLKGIFKTGVGTDNLPFDAAAERGVEIGLPLDKARDVIFTETADFACYLILQCLYRQIGDFASWKKHSRESLGSRNVLVIGTGNIGNKVCQKMKAFCEVSTFDALKNDESELEALVKAADCISLHIPLTDRTRDFFDAERLGWMKEGAAIVNTARGGVISEPALLSELETGRIFAAIDVFWKEPYSGKLTELSSDKVILTPHVASTCRQFLTETANDLRTFIDKLSG